MCVGRIRAVMVKHRRKQSGCHISRRCADLPGGSLLKEKERMLDGVCTKQQWICGWADGLGWRAPPSDCFKTQMRNGKERGDGRVLPQSRFAVYRSSIGECNDFPAVNQSFFLQDPRYVLCIPQLAAVKICEISCGAVQRCPARSIPKRAEPWGLRCQPSAPRRMYTLSASPAPVICIDPRRAQRRSVAIDPVIDVRVHRSGRRTERRGFTTASLKGS